LFVNRIISGMKIPKTKIAFIGSYTPRKCGIATFTSDLVKNIASAADDDFEPHVFAMETDAGLNYVKPVRKVIRKFSWYDYIIAADLINQSDIDLVNLQYEFGLFYGTNGSFLSAFLRRLTKPVVTTLHTVLEEPESEFFEAMLEVCDASDRVVVMNECGVDMLRRIYCVPTEKIELIGHGIPDLPFAETSCFKRKLGLAGRKTILTFGLLSENKGIDLMLRAMPEIIARDSSALYIVLGATHPEVLRHEGPVYRLKLEKMISKLGLDKHVILDHRFVEDNELFQYLKAADVYVTPYLNRQQLTSGTLAFAVGSGRAVVSTPYWAAQELLADGRGKLVDFCDPLQMAKAVTEILANPALAMSMRAKAYEYGRSITWPRVGRAYWQLFQEVLQMPPAIARPSFMWPVVNNHAAMQVQTAC
jgi:glycosyltransferase involved in cell wall biosynthesis